MELSLERPPKQPGLAAQLPHVTPSLGRLVRMPASPKRHPGAAAGLRYLLAVVLTLGLSLEGS